MWIQASLNRSDGIKKEARIYGMMFIMGKQHGPIFKTWCKGDWKTNSGRVRMLTGLDHRFRIPIGMRTLLN
jgi:hypothetical protein